MRILFEELPPQKRAGGIETVTTEAAKHLRAAGVSVSRISEAYSRSGLPDLVHVHGIWSPRLAHRVLQWRKRGVPCLVSPHGMLEPWAMRHKQFKKALAWWLYQKSVLNRCSAIHAAAQKEAIQFGRLGLKPTTVVVPWGVTLPDSLLKPVNGKAPIALFVGRICPVKGLPMLIKAWARAKPQKWLLRIVGPDEAGHRAEVEALVRDLGLQAEVEFAGPLQGTAKASALESASLFVLPSFTENFSMSVAEALAYRLPVITTKGTPWEELETRQCGYWVDIGVEPLAQAISQMTRLSQSERRAMGDRGHKWVASEFSWPRFTAGMLAFYSWLLA